MKVLFINVVCGIKSTGKIVAAQAEKYMAEGHEVRIAYGRENADKKYKDISYRITSDSNVKINALKARMLDNEGFNAKVQTDKFINWANTYNPDVLWLHNLHGYYLNIEKLFKWIKTRPEMQVRWTLHDCWAFTGHCSHFSIAKCNKWQHQCEKCPLKTAYPASVLMDNSFKNFQNKKAVMSGIKNMTLITPSQWLADRVRQSFLKEYPVEVIRTEIDTEVFKPTKSNFRNCYGLENKKIVLGVATAWVREKGLQDFITLSSMLDESYRIVLVGLTSTQIRSLPASIIGIEKTNNSIQLAEIYTAADVFVNLTYQDTYPTVNLEAQACGTICLTYETDGAVETVPADCVVEQGNLELMTKKIQEVCMKG